MSNSDGVMIYQFAAVESVSQAINTFTHDMNEQLNNLDARFKGLLANGWEGAAANSFGTLSAQWHQQADAMATTLQTLAQKVGNASVSMQQADQAAAARF